MTQITKSEAEAIREYLPEAHIRRTVHKFFVEESRAVLDYLRRLRESGNGSR